MASRLSNRRSIRGRRQRRRIGSDFELQLTSMMDMLIIIVVFLLKSYTVSQNNLSSVKGIQLPRSANEVSPPDSLQVIVTPEGITFESEKILEFVVSADQATDTSQSNYTVRSQDLDEGGRRILPLFEALTKAKEKSELLRAKSAARDEKGNPLPFEGVLAIQADKRIRYETVRRIMYSAAAAGYKTFRFLALRQEI